MNIHKLTLAGFGSYLEPQTIEFGKFGANALFLITGPTGGGKTTILNAITYALSVCSRLLLRICCCECLCGCFLFWGFFSPSISSL